jgi:hypothetical protein
MTSANSIIDQKNQIEQAEISYRLEPLVPIFQEALKLWEGHWAETEVAYRTAPLNPDYKQLTRLEELGWSRYYTARIGDKLVGHLYFIVYQNRHTQTKTAVEDFFYFLPEARLGTAAIKLLRFAVADLKSEDCDQVGMSSKLTGKKDIDPLLRRVGFRHVANFYVI